MKVKIEDKKKCQKIIKIEVELDKVNSALDEAYKSIARDAQLPGFRKGKAPIDIIKTRYKETAYEEAIRHLVWDSYKSAIEENKIIPINYPIIENITFKENSPLSFIAKIDTEPVINLRTYTGIKIKKIAAEVSDKEINEALERIRSYHARFDIVNDRPIQRDDYIVCDYSILVDNVEIEKKSNAWMHISKDSAAAMIADKVLGMKKSDERSISLRLPEDFKNSKYANKEAVYKINVKEIKTRVLPELNDGFAKEVGSFKDLQELKNRVSDEIKTGKQQQQKLNMENQLFDFLLNNNQFEVPESVVENQLQVLINDAKNKLMYQGYQEAEIKSQEEKLKETLSMNAEKQVKIFFILENIAQAEAINVTDQDLDEKTAEMAKLYGQKKENYLKSLQEKGLITSLKKQILHDKVVDFLISKSKITE